MSASEFLAKLAAIQGAEALEGALVFAMLDRPIDELISKGLANGPYHRGRPSPWSHCFLIAEPFRGPATRILDCTIRDPQGRISWNLSLPEALQIVFATTAGKGAGGIYDAQLGDYDDPRVTARGLKFLPGLSAEERARIVARARELQAEQVRYDLPGLLRELVHLLVGVPIPPAAHRLFCSAFLQKAYRAALGNVGDFALKIRDEDTTPDDLWYAQKGIAIADVPELPERHSPQTLSLFGGAALPTAERGLSALASVPPPGTRQELERVLQKLKTDPARSNQLEDVERIRDTIENALQQLDRVSAEGSLRQSDTLLHADDYDLSLVLSALTSPREPSELGPMFGRDISGFHGYEDFDPRWIASLWNRLTRSKVPFPVARNVADVVYTIPDEATIAIAGDWGTGNKSSRQIAQQIAKLGPDYTIHLGDVYYSGTESEERKRLTELWPAGKAASLALNSNHEMYSGGHGYFGVALAHAKFRLQQGYSYFALSNRTWLIIGLDSAYGSSGLYGNGVVNDAQLAWLRALMKSDFARSGGAPKNILLLSHHQALEMDGKQRDLFGQVTAALGRGPQRWYWGHVHGVAAFQPINVNGGQLRARLVGHGGVPYAPDPLTNALLWTENELAKDPDIPERARNGFALLRFSAGGLEESLYDEFGALRWRE